MYCKNEFWLENPPDILCSYNLFPMKGMSLEEQMNSLSRLVFLLFIPSLLITDIKYSVITLLVCIVIISVTYFMVRKKLRENFEEKINCARNKKRIGNLIENYENMTCNRNCPQNVNSLSEMDILNINQAKNREIEIKYTINNERYIPPNCPQLSSYYGGNPNRFKGKRTELAQGSDYFSYNQSLAGQANARTLIPPVITPKCYDMKYWRANDLINFSQINAKSVEDTFQSGYDVSTCCSSYCKNNDIQGTQDIYAIRDWNLNCNIPEDKPCEKNGKEKYNNNNSKNKDNNYRDRGTDEDGTIENGEYYDEENSDNFSSKEMYKNGEILEGFIPGKELFVNNDMISVTKTNAKVSTYKPECKGYKPTDESWNYTYPYSDQEGPNDDTLGPLKTGQINVACGYNPENVKWNLPTNAIIGACQKTDKMRDYNNEIYTQTIQPGVYSKSQIVQPLNSNIGISFQQQFEPVTCEKTCDGLNYTLHDPRLPVKHGNNKNECGPINKLGQRVNENNVYDPRFEGYGTSYRSYVDELTGQPRFMYDDINSIRMPNYITRNKLDFQPRMPHYGPVPDANEGLGAVKKYANDLYTKCAIQQRNDLTERWMEKQNTILAQRRTHPITRNKGMMNRIK